MTPNAQSIIRTVMSRRCKNSFAKFEMIVFLMIQVKLSKMEKNTIETVMG